jgi:hypothetical protein
VSLAFLEFMILHFSQQNTLLSVPSYNIEITQHKHANPIQKKSSNANNWEWLILHFIPVSKLNGQRLWLHLQYTDFEMIVCKLNNSDLESNGSSKIYWRDLICFTITRMHIVMAPVT